MLLRLLRLAVAWTFAAVYWTLAGVLCLLTFKRLPLEFFQRALRRWAAATAWLLGLRIELVNESPLETRESRVVVFNHQSGLDMIWVALIAPPGAVAIGKKEIRWVPVVNLAWWVLDFIYVDRADPRRAALAIRGVSRKVAEERRSLLIAPEGTRSRDGELLPFKRGAFHMALRAKAPIQPVVIDGPHQLMPRGKLIPKPGTIKVRFLPPIPTAGMDDHQADELAKDVREKMAQALADLRR